MDSDSKQQPNESSEPHATIPGLAPRLLAMLIDYLVIAAATLLFGKVSAYGDAAFFITFFVGAVYFGSANSRLLDGQSLGKRAFGLRVLSTRQDQLYLRFTEGLLRYFYTYGAIILLAEVPTLLYRAQEIIASPLLLELHMLVVMAVLFSNVTTALFRQDRRALHDLLSGSIVVRGVGDFEYEIPARRLLWPMLAGSCAAFLLWLPSVTHPEEVEAVQRIRYLLENRTPLRLVGAGSSPDILAVHLVYSGEVRADRGRSPDAVPPQVSEPVEEAARLIREHLPKSAPQKSQLSFRIDAIDSEYQPQRYHLTLPLAEQEP